MSVTWTINNIQHLQQAFTKRLEQLANQAIQERGVFHIALSGGSLPAFLARCILSSDGLSQYSSGSASPSPSSSSVLLTSDFTRWHWWWADERCATLQHADSNYAEANKQIFQPLQWALHGQRMNVHTIRNDLVHDPAAAATAYADEISSHVSGGVFDVILLGMGPDGHTCSLFPAHPLLQHTQNIVAPIFDSPKPPPQRITMTYPLLNRSRTNIMVVTGSNKADIIAQVHQQYTHNVEMEQRLPSARINNQLYEFWLDDDAGQRIKPLTQQGRL